LSKELDGLRQEICEKKENNQKFEQEKNDLLAELEDTIDQVNLLKRELESQKQNYD
jgi:negative regulator of sigma E activity